MVYFASVLSAGRINAKTCFVLSQSFFLATWIGIWFKCPVACLGRRVSLVGVWLHHYIHSEFWRNGKPWLLQGFWSMVFTGFCVRLVDCCSLTCKDLFADPQTRRLWLWTCGWMFVVEVYSPNKWTQNGTPDFSKCSRVWEIRTDLGFKIWRSWSFAPTDPWLSRSLCFLYSNVFHTWHVPLYSVYESKVQRNMNDWKINF